MQKPTAESLALFKAIAPSNGTDFSDFTNELYTATKSLHNVMDMVQRRVTELEGKLRDADSVEEAPDVYSKFEQIKQKLGAMRRLTAEAQHALDRLRDTSVNLDAHGIKCQRAMKIRAERVVAE